jgi:hypothetical protein
MAYPGPPQPTLTTRVAAYAAYSVDPAAYVCSMCGRAGCKLWHYNGITNFKLYCAACALANQKLDGAISEDGTHQGKNWIGWLDPSIPPSNDPVAGLVWWRSRRTHAEARSRAGAGV